MTKIEFIRVEYTVIKFICFFISPRNIKKSYQCVCVPQLFKSRMSARLQNILTVAALDQSNVCIMKRKSDVWRPKYVLTTITNLSDEYNIDNNVRIQIGNFVPRFNRLHRRNTIVTLYLTRYCITLYPGYLGNSISREILLWR